MKRILIAVIGSGEADHELSRTAFDVGSLVAQRGWVVVTGGRDAGVMRSAAQGAASVPGSTTVGILPDGASEVSRAVHIPIITDTGEARNNIIARSADAVIACGADDPGTVSEICLAIKASKPVVLLAVSDMAYTFLSSLGGKLVRASSPAEAVEAASAAITGAA